jgi:Cell wall hydrolyses involved in spore germination
MIKLNKFKSLVLALTFTLFSAQAAHAATYTVAKGDTLSSIGRLFGTSYTNIMGTNSLRSTTIYPGQVLNVPGSYHTVQSGETLYSISRKYGVTVDALKKANAEWDNLIYVGQKLLIPAKTTTITTTSVTRPAVIPYTTADLELLAKLIHAETENQTYRAKVAVGAVVVNRVQSSLFPNTISGVIYQRINGYYQFTPVLNGHINNTPSSEARRAAYEALHGSDPTNGALFFFDNTVTNNWLLSKPVALRDGKMIFAY